MFALLVVALLMYPLMYPFVRVEAISLEPPEEEYTLELPAYKPVKISFNYPYTHNHSIYDVSTIGASLYSHQGGPTLTEFLAPEVDDYYFSLDLGWLTPQGNQTILVGFWSGTESMKSFAFKPRSFTHIQFHVRLRVGEQPTYPTEEEVAQQVVAQVQKNLADYYNAQVELQRTQNMAIMTASILSVIAVSAAIIGTALHIFELRQARKLGVRR